MTASLPEVRVAPTLVREVYVVTLQRALVRECRAVVQPYRMPALRLIGDPEARLLHRSKT